MCMSYFHLLNLEIFHTINSGALTVAPVPVVSVECDKTVVEVIGIIQGIVGGWIEGAGFHSGNVH